MGHCLEAQNNMMNMAAYLIITNVGMNVSSHLLHAVLRRSCSIFFMKEKVPVILEKLLQF